MATGEAAPLMEARRLSKKFSHTLRRGLSYALRDLAGELLPMRGAALGADEFWALDEISFSVRPGEALAVVGRNGAGKSTLLKLAAGLLKPDRGELRRRGTIEPIIELGTGLNPLLSGRENLRVAAAVKGLRGTAARRFEEEALAFAELEAAAATPVQSYSTGMRARLAFAAAAYLRPDLLLVDEALTVGDFAFQRKCMSWMRDYLADGGAVLLVSHNVAEIQALCRRALLLDGGRAVAEGDAIEVLNRMLQTRSGGAASALVPRRSDGSVEIAALDVLPSGGGLAETNGAVDVVLRYDAREARNVLWTFSVWKADPWTCVTRCLAAEERRIGPGAGELVCRVPRLPLVGGQYIFHAAIFDPATRQLIARYGDVHLGTPLDVATRADAWGNMATVEGQLVVMDVEWPSG